jgi:CheY-like chemotaxis protein
MSVMTLFSSSFCEMESFTKRLQKQTDYRIMTDTDLAAHAAALSGMDVKKIQAVFRAKASVFNNFTRERERSVAWLRLATAEMLSQDNLIISGYCGHLIPNTITHVLRICLVADLKSRIATAQANGLSEKDAMQKIRSADEDRAVWVETLFKIRDPWDPSIYDIVLPMDKTDLGESIELVEENLRSEVILPTDASRRAAEDFILSARVGVALAKEGHYVDVSARDGAVTITINKNVLMLNRLQDELKRIAQPVDGVTSVETRIGKGFHRADVYRKYDFDVPKLLLVDDEREFVQTLSERLLMREVHSATAYDGETALDILSEDEPEVMILDLKMPGIDGIEVLKKVKATRPEVEVIILTGHGSEKDQEVCMSLGAFAYLQKPVDIDVLTETLKKANEAIRRKRQHK